MIADKIETEFSEDITAFDFVEIWKANRDQILRQFSVLRSEQTKKIRTAAISTWGGSIPENFLSNQNEWNELLVEIGIPKHLIAEMHRVSSFAVFIV